MAVAPVWSGSALRCRRSCRRPSRVSGARFAYVSAGDELPRPPNGSDYQPRDAAAARPRRHKLSHAAHDSQPCRPQFTAMPTPQFRTRFASDERPTTLSGPQRLAPSSQHLSPRCPGGSATHWRRTVAQNGRSDYQRGAPGPDALYLGHSGVPSILLNKAASRFSRTKKPG